MSRLMIQWLALRLAAPLIMGAAVVAATDGRSYFDIFGPLVWTLFVVHLVCTFSFKKTHVLDTGAFIFLIVACGAIAAAGEHGYSRRPSTFLGPALFYMIYLLFSFVGIHRASVDPAPPKSVGFSQVLAAIAFLVVSVLICSISKVAVGFLFVPGILVLPVLLLWLLAGPKQKFEQPNRQSVVPEPQDTQGGIG